MTRRRLEANLPNPPAEYCQNNRSQSTTALTDPGKIRPPRRGKRGAGEAGTPSPAPKRLLAQPPAGVRLYGPRTPVSLTLRYAGGSEPWIEVTTTQGRFWVIGTGSVLDLVNRVIAGGFPIKATAAQRSRRRWQS